MQISPLRGKRLSEVMHETSRPFTSHRSQLRSELASKEPHNESLLLDYVQVISKRWTPACVKLGKEVALCLPSAGRRAQLFHLIFTQPGAHLLEIPCITGKYVPNNLHSLADGSAEEESRAVEVRVHHGDADEDDVGQVGEHRRQEHEVTQLLAEAGSTIINRRMNANPSGASFVNLPYHGTFTQPSFHD